MGLKIKEPLRVWIGYDSSESRTFDVCAKSILRRTSAKVDIYPLRQEFLRSLGLYYRHRDPLASTEFSFTRFLVPALAGYSGAALFVDSDFVFLTDIVELFSLYDPYYAIQCVQHEDYEPTSATKMGGLLQTSYSRKNWTSLFLVNAGHPAVLNNLTPHEVNKRSGKYLHRLEWVDDVFIDALPREWNCLDGHPIVEHPKAVHLTLGTPAIHGNISQYGHYWDAEAAA